MEEEVFLSKSEEVLSRCDCAPLLLHVSVNTIFVSSLSERLSVFADDESFVVVCVLPA